MDAAGCRCVCCGQCWGRSQCLRPCLAPCHQTLLVRKLWEKAAWERATPWGSLSYPATSETGRANLLSSMLSPRMSAHQPLASRGPWAQTPCLAAQHHHYQCCCALSGSLCPDDTISPSHSLVPFLQVHKLSSRSPKHGASLSSAFPAATETKLNAAHSNAHVRVLPKRDYAVHTAL